jgi:ABC-type Fe3+ transport system permease subunit
VLRYCFGLVAILSVACLVYLGVGAIIDGYFSTNIIPDRSVPASWAAPDSWSEWRDIVIVICGLFFAVAIVILIVILFVLLRLVMSFRKLTRDRIEPAVDTIRDLVDSLRATADFIGESVVSPIIRIYGVVTALKTLLFGANRFFDNEQGTRGLSLEWKTLFGILNRVFDGKKDDQR